MVHVYDKTRVPMRDGVSLAATVFRLEGTDGPSLLMLSPYGFDPQQLQYPDTISLLNAGYNLVWVSCRGTFGSEGVFAGVSEESDDGYDAVEWLIQQPWSDGNVGTYGLSYIGVTQWAIAASRHPALKAMAPVVTSMDWYRAPSYHPGGALSLSCVAWWHTFMRLNDEVAALGAGTGDPARLDALVGEFEAGPAAFEITPIIDKPLASDDVRLHQVLSNPDFSDEWSSSDFSDVVSTLTAPVLMVAGWFDLFVLGTLSDFEKVVTESPSESVRTGSRLVIGPWNHDLTSNFPAVDFGVNADPLMADLTGEHLRHFQQWLPVGDPVAQTAAPVKLFVMGINQWREEQSWPLPDTRYTDFYLDTGGAEDAGRLLVQTPQAAGVREYSYDPRNPVPTRGGAHYSIPRQNGPVDQREIEDRQDVLSFTTDPLPSATEVTGYVSATLFVSSDAKDTDFTARLVDVYPDGTALSVCDGIIRARYRNSLSHPEALEPGAVYEVHIEMDATSLVFAEGHRIRVDISSSNFPRFDRNTNTGGFISGEAIDESVVARNSLYTGPQHPSRVTLPLISREG